VKTFVYGSNQSVDVIWARLGDTPNILMSCATHSYYDDSTRPQYTIKLKKYDKML